MYESQIISTLFITSSLLGISTYEINFQLFGWTRGTSTSALRFSKVLVLLFLVCAT